MISYLLKSIYEVGSILHQPLFWFQPTLPLTCPFMLAPAHTIMPEHYVKPRPKSKQTTAENHAKEPPGKTNSPFRYHASN